MVDPDVDRLALICEDGEPFGEEYTLVAVADYILSINKKQKNTTVSNLSSTMALKDVTINHGGEYFSAAVGRLMWWKNERKGLHYWWRRKRRNYFS